MTWKTLTGFMAITQEWKQPGHYLEATYLHSLKMQKRGLCKTLKEQCQICREKYSIRLPCTNVEELVARGAIMCERKHIPVLLQDFWNTTESGSILGYSGSDIHAAHTEARNIHYAWFYSCKLYIGHLCKILLLFLARSLLALSHVSLVKINSTNCHFFYY